MSVAPRVLVAGIGNLFLGDDGFGSEVARRLAERPLPAGVRIVDFGVRGFDLAYALLDGYDAAILIDAARRGGAPGTLYLIEPALGDAVAPDVATHGMHPARALKLARALGGSLPRLRLLACEPAISGSGDDDGDIAVGLSAPVAASVEPAIEMVEALLRRIIEEPGDA